MEEVQIKVENISYQCPSCGGNMTYDPVTESLHCSYCETTTKIEELKSTEEFDLSEGLSVSNNWNEGKSIFHCKYCGADNIKDSKDLSSQCPFCGSDSVIKLDELPGIKPHRVIPFKISKDEALKKFQMKLKKSFYAPKKLKKEYQETPLSGIYLPSWTFDSHAITDYRGVLGKYYTRTVGSGKDRRTVTEIRWFPIRGVKTFDFDDVLVTSGKTLTNDQMSNILPYNTNDSLVYDEAYLAGYNAEHYTVSLEDGWDLSKNKTDDLMKQSILNQYHYDVVRDYKQHSVYSNIKFKYVLLPVWKSHYKYRNKDFYFIVNGSTGKVGGKMPVSFWKVSMTVLFVILIIALIVILFNY